MPSNINRTAGLRPIVARPKIIPMTAAGGGGGVQVGAQVAALTPVFVEAGVHLDG